MKRRGAPTTVGGAPATEPRSRRNEASGSGHGQHRGPQTRDEATRRRDGIVTERQHMSRINTNVSSLIAQRVLRKNNDTLNTSLERLSTGLKINSGKDNPAGLIASENLRAEKTGITTAIDNAGRPSNTTGTAEGGLNEVSSLLNELQGLVGSTANAGGLSAEEKQANQPQVDSILGTINRIAASTSFQGKKLLNGSLDYTTSAVA